MNNDNTFASSQHRHLSERGIIIIGPTASGKSHLANLLAQTVDGIIINADSMQLYRSIEVLNDAPCRGIRLKIPHRLYGCFDAGQSCDVARWRQMALKEIARAQQLKKIPIIVGGSGLYVKTLLDGIAPIPEIAPHIRAETRRMAETMPVATMHHKLQQKDPQTAERIHPHDRQRLIRAWEVLLSSGKSLSCWQKTTTTRALCQCPKMLIIKMSPPRSTIYHRCNQRVDAMLRHGAVDTVCHLLKKNIDPELPAMKAIGVPSLRAFLQSQCSLAEAIAEMKKMTRHYARRQYIWQKTQAPQADMTLTYIPVDANRSRLSLWLKKILTKRILAMPRPIC